MSWAAKKDSKGLDKIHFLLATQLRDEIRRGKDIKPQLSLREYNEREIKKLPIYQCINTRKN